MGRGVERSLSSETTTPPLVLGGSRNPVRGVRISLCLGHSVLCSDATGKWQIGDLKQRGT